MKRSVGIVREAYSAWERRAPFTPDQVRKMVNQLGIEVRVQPSGKRVFADREYAAAGAVVTEDLSGANAIFGVKQVGIDELLEDKTYLFFSHVIKGQLENMELLEAIKRKNVRLIDYEVITKGGEVGAPRLVAFGEYAGKAGFISTLRGLGQQLLYKGLSTPFLNVGSPYMYESYKAATEAVGRAGDQFVRAQRGAEATPFNPLVFMFTGTGNVNRGARQVFRKLPHTWVEAGELAGFLEKPSTEAPIVGCQVGLADMVRRRDGAPFLKEEFYARPELYESVFYKDVGRHANVLVNGIYWDARYPRVISREDLERPDPRRLHFISDISCDIGGGIEALHTSTTVEDPFAMVKEPEQARDIMLMGVDILPSELPREASQHFGDYLLPFVGELAAGAATDKLPAEVAGACIVDQGALRDRYSYIEKMKQERLREANNFSSLDKASALQLEGSTVVRLEGHLFDTNLINRMLDAVEEAAGRFCIVESAIGTDGKSTLLLQLTMDAGRADLDAVLERMRALASDAEFAGAEAALEEMPQSFCMGDYRATLDAPRLVPAGYQKDAASRQPHGAGGSIDSGARREDRDGASRPLQWVPLKTVAVLGAGMVARPCVELLSRDSSRNVVVCSADFAEAKALADGLGRGNVEPARLDALDLGALGALVERCDAVISLLPATMHVPVAELCIQHGTRLTTASYISPEMRKLDEAARERGVSILGEMGLDPGMDHMSAMQVIDQMKAEGETVESFTSLCGGLVAPEAANNPFGYKFSWSPIGVLRAMGNNARFFKDGKLVTVDGGAPLLASAEPFRMHNLPSLALEQLPNRDSTVYSETYQIQEAHTCFRGTLRYEGFSRIVGAYLKGGLLATDRPWKDTLADFLAANTDASDPALSALHWLLADASFDQAALQDRPSIEALAALLEHRMSLAPGERDMCVMQHTFNGTDRVSSLLAYGNEDGTAMARTVGLTVAIGAELFLDEHSAAGLEGAAGVLMPTEERIYTPALTRLEEEGFTFTHYNNKTN